MDQGTPVSYEQDSQSRGKLSGMRVMLVEDSEEAMILFKYFLTSEFARVEAFQSSLDALESFKENPGRFDIIVSDIGLPSMNGYDLLKEIRAIDPVVPAIALTAFASKSDIQEAYAAGFNLHMTKPVLKSNLVEQVHRVALQC